MVIIYKFYTNGNPKPYDLVSSDGSPPRRGLRGGRIGKCDFAARTATDSHVNPFANLIRCRFVYSYFINTISFADFRNNPMGSFRSVF